MNIEIQHVEGTSIAFLKDKSPVINSVQDAVDLLGNSDYQGARKIIVQESQLSSEFFDLKTGLAGEILQKFSNYRVQLAIVGDFSKYSSKALHDFIFESNKSKQVFFKPSNEDAVQALCG